MRLLHFTAEWCKPCQMMKPMIAQVLENHPEIEYISIDVDENAETANDYEIMGVPTFIVVGEDDSILSIAVGAMQRAKFESFINLEAN